tara:strand:- start:71 stop:553 length:483 start_codon:yes stop_codon:yes gene_type:complete
MLDHADIRIDVIESKKKIFAHVTLKGRRPVKSLQVKNALLRLGHDVGTTKVGTTITEGKGLFVFDIGDGIVKQKSLREKAVENFKPEELNQVDLVLSHAGSDPELAPEEITDPELAPEAELAAAKAPTPKPKTTTRTRKPSTRTRKPRVKKTPTNNNSNQ